MSFESYFRACSYAMVASGVLALAVSGGVGVWLAAGFAAVLAVSWRLAGTRWQLSERAGMYVVLLALPAFYLDWRFQRGAAADAAGQVYAGVSALVHFTLLLSSIKLLQIKSDRDWLFLYLISFFEVLLAAGLTSVVGLQALIILAGSLELIPLTGITLPFVSYGGSSLLANYVLLAHAGPRPGRSESVGSYPRGNRDLYGTRTSPGLLRST